MPRYGDTTPNARLDYVRELFAPEDDLLREIRVTLAEKNRSIHVNPEEGKLLQVLATLHGAKTIVEVGTLGAYSTIWLARALADDGHLYSFELNPDMATLAQHHIERAQLADTVTIITGDAKETLPSINDHGPFDMIFIDADKSSYPNYLDWAEENVCQGGLIIADNTFLFDSVYLDQAPTDLPVGKAAHGAMRSVNERLANPQKYSGILIPTDEGLTIAKKLF